SRMKDVDFSLPIFVDGGSVLVRAKSRIAKLADLRGRKIAVIAGTTTEQALVAAFGVVDAHATLVPIADAVQGAALLAAGKVDGYAGDRIVLAAIALSASAQPPSDDCDACGVVQSIRMTTERAQWTPLGSATPAIVTPSGAQTGAMTQFAIGPQLQNQGLVMLGAAGGAAYA